MAWSEEGRNCCRGAQLVKGITKLLKVMLVIAAVAYLARWYQLSALLQWQPLTVPAVEQRSESDVPTTFFTVHKHAIEMLPKCLQDNFDRWRQLNPKLRLRYFSHSDRDKWIRAHTTAAQKAAFNKLPNYASKADMFRMLYQYTEGGVWIDADVPAHNLSQMSSFKAKLELFDMGRGPSFMVIGSRPGHPMIGEMLSRAEYNVNNHPTLDNVFLAGPGVFQRILTERYFSTGILPQKANIQIMKWLLPYGSMHVGSDWEFRYNFGFPQKSTRDSKDRLMCYGSAMASIGIQHWMQENEARGVAHP